MKTLFGMELDAELGPNYHWVKDGKYEVMGMDDETLSNAYKVEVVGKKLLVASSCDLDTHGNKITRTYDSHLWTVAFSGFRRAFTPQEAFGLIMMNEEGNLSPDLDGLVDNMLSGEGEYTSSAALYDGDMLHVFEYVKDIIWDEDKREYIVPEHDDWHSNRESFELGGIDGWVDLPSLYLRCPESIEYMFGRRYKDIPERLKKGNSNISIFISNDGMVRPIAIGDYGQNNILCTNGARASRGVYEIR